MYIKFCKIIFLIFIFQKIQVKAFQEATLEQEKKFAERQAREKKDMEGKLKRMQKLKDIAEKKSKESKEDKMIAAKNFQKEKNKMHAKLMKQQKDLMQKQKKTGVDTKELCREATNKNPGAE